MQEIKEDITYYLTSVCIWVIKKINPHKNRILAQRMKELAHHYEP